MHNAFSGDISEYTIHYKSDDGDWKSQQLGSSVDRYTLTGLKCGSRYQLYMTASNSLGTGEPSSPVFARTQGAALICLQTQTSYLQVRNGSEDKLMCRRGHLRLSESHDDIFLGDDGFRHPGSTLRSQQTRGFSQLISAFKEPPTRQLSTLYDLTAGMEPDFGLFCGSLLPSDLGVAFYSTGNNVTLSVYLPPRSSVGTASMVGSFGLYLTYR
ncbi:CUB domain-containing protein [Trichonephila inaurata madagascariensis]|uniref:CUB domain-containing protein n=1 Tax=Trichonephila inaurata madagascariensis TaxID=2747483 RepID=A0A8X6YD32_9ARAC|nr:CUB domain-containing protein [Trichonephila inaurata madagascariensis]